MNTREIKELLLYNLSQETKLFVADIATRDPAILKQLWQWLTMEDDPLRWRACWIFEEICVTNSHIKKQYLVKIAQHYPTLTHEPSQRMLGKILSLTEIPEAHESMILNAAFNWMQDIQKPAAVRVHAMQIAFNLTIKYPELKHELKCTISHIYDSGSRGFKNRAGKLLAQL